MSKTQLKKEIQQLPREQLEMMILEAYDARKEIKEYFDFFVNPDINKLREKFRREVSGELFRSKHGYSKGRITNLRRTFKHFQGFHPGFEEEIDMLFYIIATALECEKRYHFQDTLIRGIALFMLQMVDIADSNLVADKALARLTALLSDERAGGRYFRRFLRDELGVYRPS